MKIFNFSIIYFIAIIPIFYAGGFFVYKFYFKNKKFNDSNLSKMRNYKYSKISFSTRIIFLLFSLFFLFISVLRPVWGVKKNMVESMGSDIVFTLDVSQSMKALDIGNGSLDRLTMAKAMIEEFVSLHPENRYGLVIFAGEAFVSTPLTMDISAFLTFLDGVDYNDIGKQGTDIKAALKASINRFYSEQDKKRGRSVVIISDGGEEMSGDISSFVKVAHKLNIKIFTVGIGSTKGVPIPEKKDVFGRITYKKYQGKIVTSRLNDELLKRIADETNGEYFAAEKKGDLERIVSKLKMLESTSIKTEENAGKEDYFQYFLLPAFLFFILFEFGNEIVFLVNNSKTYIKKYLKFSSFLILMFVLSGCTDNNNIAFRYYNTQGNKKYAKAYYQEAKEKYEKAGKSSHNLKYISDNNFAVVEYSEEYFKKAIDKLEKNVFIYCKKEKKEYCDILYYNLGNSYYRLGQLEKDNKQSDLWQKAVSSYKKDLEINTDDKDAQENIDFILDKIKKQKETNKQDEQGGQNKQNKQEAGDEQKQNNSQNEKQDNKNADKKNTGQAGGSRQDSKSEDDSGKAITQNNKGTDNNQKKEDGSETKNLSTDNQKQSGQTNSDKLDDKTSQQVETYMHNLEKQEKNNQNYFQPNPNGLKNNKDPFDDFFNNSFMDDPFFKNFFGNNPSSGNFDNKKDNNEIDW